MCCQRFLLYTVLFLFPVINGKANTIRMTLYKEAAYDSADAFIDNADYYTQVLKFFYGQRSPEIPVAKIDANVDYRAGIELGFPKRQRLVVNIDTSFSGLWVPSSSCFLSRICYEKNHYTNKDSVEYAVDFLQNEPQKRSITYGVDPTKSEVSGNLGFDTLWVDEFEIPGVHLLEATDMSYEPFHKVIGDGVFGLSFPSESLKMASPLFTMMDRGVLDSTEVSLFIGRKTQSGELLLGGRNHIYYNKESLRFHQLVSFDEWKIKVDSIQFQGQALSPNSTEAVIDTGSAAMAVPLQSLKVIYKTLKLVYSGHAAKVTCSTRWSMPVLKIIINGQILSMNGYQYVIETRKGDCVLGFIESPKTTFWILGNTFLSTVYTIFDAGGMTIGFANLNTQCKIKIRYFLLK